MSAQDPDLVRKSPNQTRARQTVETILEATAQILTEDGSARLTTNYLARKAGFSIGTIYQYFPNREAIVLALIDRQRDVLGQRIAVLLAAQRDAGTEDRIRGVVHVLHEAFNVHRMPDRGLMLALLQIAVARGLPTPPNTAVHAIVTIWMEGDGRGGAALDESEQFVLTRSVIEVLRQAALTASPLLGTAEFETALLRMIMGFLRG